MPCFPCGRIPILFEEAGVRSCQAVIFIFLVLAGLSPVLLSEEPELSISGRIRGLKGNDHVVIQAVRDSKICRTTTRAAGTWSLEHLEQGIYLMTPIHARYHFEPEKIRVKLEGRSIKDLQFSAQPLAEDSVIGVDRR